MYSPENAGFIRLHSERLPIAYGVGTFRKTWSISPI
jgi:hypothetical protein